MDARELMKAAEGHRDWIVGLRRSFHMNPELGLREVETADAVEAALAGLGVERSRRGTAIVGIVRGGLPGGAVALRADMDALPVAEAGDSPYRSRREGVMHACGHDGHMAILLGAARILAERRDSLAGDVKLFFQPAEETDGGAADMVRAGCLENPRVQATFGLHLMPYLPVGKVEVKKGALNGASTRLKIAIKGRGGHGAYPESGIDAILIAANVVTSLNALVSRYVSPLEQAVITVGKIAGGTGGNIIADEVRMEGTMRTTSDAVREALIARSRFVVEGVSAAFGGSGALEVAYGYEALVNHDAEVDLVAAAAGELLGDGSLVWKEKPSMGVEDFSYFIKDRPGAFYHLGCGNAGKGITAPLHSAAFDLDEDCLPLGAALQALVAVRALARGKGDSS